MKMSDAFPSNYLTAADLKGKSWPMTIENVEMSVFQNGESKPCLKFKGAKKGMILNKTNALLISESYGDETDGWIGKEVTLKPTKTVFQGKTYTVIRIEVPMPETVDEEPPDFMEDDMNENPPWES